MNRVDSANRRNSLFLRKVGKAISDYEMIQDKDKVLVGVSWDEKSLSLLFALLFRRRFVPIDYEVLAVHIFSNELQSQLLEGFFKERNLDYYYERLHILDSKITFYREETVFNKLSKIAKKLGFNKVAFSDNFDDFIERILFCLLFEARIPTISPKQIFSNGIVLIRPLVYVEERILKDFIKKEGFDNFSFKEDSDLRYKRIKELIKELERLDYKVKKNIFRSLKRVRKDYLL